MEEKFLFGYTVHAEDFINHLADEYYGTSYLINEGEIEGFWASMTWLPGGVLPNMGYIGMCGPKG